MKKIAKSVTHKVEKVGEKAKKNLTKSPSKDKDQAAIGSDKFDNSLNRFSDPFAKIKGAPSRGSLRGRKNLDPGVNSDDEDDDDMFKFDALSQGSSGSSLNVSKIDNLGTVSKTSTPLSGSLENLGGGELLRRNTPGQSRRGFAPSNESPLVASSKSPKVPTTEDMDEWELKLLGKKGVPYTPTDFKTQRDNLSQISGISGHSATSSRTNTLERSSRLSNQEKLPQVSDNESFVPSKYN